MNVFDDHLFKLKIVKPTEQLRYEIRFQGEESEEASESGFAYVILRLNNDIDSLCEYARTLAMVCHEVRVLDGIPETPEFIYRVLRPRVFAAIGAHKRIIRQDLKSWTGVTGWTPELEHQLESSIRHLKAALKNQYEIKAIELSKQESSGGQAPQMEKQRRKSGPSDIPEVAKRRALVRSNPGVPAKEITEIFDRENVPLPSKLQDAGFNSWSRLYANPKYRNRIKVLISKDARRR